MKSILSFIISIVFLTFSAVFSPSFAQDVLISDGGTVYVSTGQTFYDAGGPTGNDGNTSYTITLCPSDPNHKVALDFVYHNTMWVDAIFGGPEEDPLYIYDGPTATGNDIGKLMGNYTVKYNTGVTPYGMGVEAFGGEPLIGTPTIFAATNASGCLTLVFENNEPGTYPGWEANIITFPGTDEPGCNIHFSPETTICPGETVTLEASGSLVSAPLNNDFNDGTIGTGWSATSAATITNSACEPSLDGSLFLWMQNAPGPRILETNAMDVSTGGTISFEYRQARNNGAPSPCESPDQGSGTFEGIYLQYSTDGGANWTTFKYIYPNGTTGSFGAEGGLTGCGDYVKHWTQMLYPIPAAAQTVNTKFRWMQSKVTSSSTDNWGLDNIVISTTDPGISLEIEDLSSGTIIASSGTSPLTVDVTPASTTSYRATISDGVTSCDSIITITVDPAGCGPEPCGTCSTPDCNIAGPYADVTEANNPGNHCSSINTLTDPANDSTYVSYHTVTTGADGTLGLIVSVGTTQLVGVNCDITRSALLYPADPCDPATAISPDAINPNPGVTFYNPEWTALAPNTTYILEISFSVPAECQLDDHCESFYFPPVSCPASVGTTSVLINGVDVTDPSNQYDVCWGDQIEFNTNNDYVLPDPASSDPNGLGYVLWSSSPTDLTAPESNAGYLGFDYNPNTGDVNDGSGFPTGTFYLAALTFDDICNTFPCDFAQGYDVDGDGCWDIGDVIEFTFHPEIIANAGANQTLTCVSPSVFLDGTASTGVGITYSWTGPGIVAGANTASPEVNAAGTYTLTITSPQGCTDTDDVVINQDASLPTADAGVDQVLDCNITSLNLDASASSSGANIDYAWSTAGGNILSGNTTTSPLINAAGTYTITVTDTGNGCTATDLVSVTENIAPPTAGITNNTGSTVIDCITTQIDVTATGGGTYDWGGGVTTAVNSFTTAGNYTVTVTGANGCTASESIIITEDIAPPTAGITNNTGSTVIDCITTQIDVTATGGGTYDWGGGVTTAANNFIAAGTYTVTVTGANGCTATESITITEDIAPPTAGITNNTGSTVIDCITTQIDVTATGGGTYDWGGGVTTAANSFIAAGTYTVTVSGANGCTATESIIITEDIAPPTAGITNNTGSTVIDCITTQIDVTATGGGTYDWGGGVTTAVNSFTTAGNYTVTVTGANGCTASESIIITEDIAPPTAGITNNTGSTVIDCITTQIDVTAIGGGTYDWGGGLTTAANSFVSAGTYTVTVSGANGCTATESITITEDIAPPTAGITNNTGSTVIDCITTQIDVTATGGGTYDWGGGITTAANSFTTAGTYTVTVTGANGCTATESITITEDIAPPTAGITNNTGTTVIDCNTSQIDVTATGGGTYDWGGGVTTAANSFTAAGNYTVTVTSANGCTATESITITEDIAPPTAGITNNTGSTVIDCITTQIDVTATGGGTYDWGGGLATVDNSFTSAGSYTVTVTGSNGCTSTENIVITEDLSTPTAGITNNTGSTVINCITTQIDVTATGGGTYDWGGGLTTAANSFVAAGTYTVTVSGANGCTATESITITEDIAPPTAGITNNTGTTEIDCNISQVDVTASGGGTYDWGGGVTTAANSFTAAGNYTVTVTSSNGCTSSDNIIITEDLTAPSADAGLDQTLTCVASSLNIDGSASSSGPEFTYTWTTASGNIISGANTPIPNVDAAGTYTLLVTNTNNGCTASDQVNITEDFVAPIASAGTDQELTCLNPTLNLDGSGSTSGSTIDYAWNTADGNIVSGTNTENPLIDAGGTYTILVTDTNNGCTASDAVLVTESFNNPTADAGIDATINCYNPTISLDATGSSTGAQFEYQWDGPTGGIISGGDGLSPTIAEAGTYSLTVTDISNACFAVDDVEIFGSFSQPSVLAGADQVLTCANLTVDLNGTGSDSGPDYDFNWTTTDGNILSGQNTLVPTVDQAGTYELTILNLVNGCEHSDQVIVTENTTPPIADAGIDMEITCENPNVTLDGSASATGADYSYLWTTTNGNILSGETSIYPTVNASGTYTLTVINNLSACTSTDEVTVLEFTSLPNVSAGEDQELTCAITSLNLDGTGSDSGSEFNILWTSFDGNIVSGQNSTTPLVNEPGIYLCTITNSLNGCQNSDEVIITENIVPPIANAGSDSEIPCGNSTIALDGSLSSIGTEFSYAWSTSNGSFVSGVNSLNPEVNSEGEYQLLVTNNTNGCTASDEVLVVESNGLNVSAVTNNVSCYGYNDGSIHLTVTGGTEPYSVNWQNGSAGASVTNLASGWYVYEIADALLCSTTDSVFISQPSSPVLFSANLENISCYSEADGAITVNVSGGTQPYEYQWQDQGSVIGNASRVQNLDEGIYQLQITDANNCQIDSLFMITQPSPITVGYTSQGPSCIGNTDGYIDLEVVGGVEPYTFYWGEFTGNLPYLDGLMEGSYAVSITDANSCPYNLGTIMLVDNPEECLRIPNAFSPNGDGTNDTWIIENLELFNNYQVEVFNRWGQVLYIGYPGADPWDGKTTEGKSVPTGSYVYIVNLFNGSEPKSGIVTIVY